MNKILILISLTFVLFTSSVFAQTDFSESGKSRSTAGQYSSDSDNLSAKDIYSIEKTFFSAGYMPALTYAGSYSGTTSSSAVPSASLHNGTMSGFWAMPINDSMTIGFSGEYQMYAYKTDSATESTLNSTLSRTETYNEYSKFNLRPVFKWNDLAFHYRLSRAAGLTGTTINKTTAISDGEQTSYSTTVNENNAGGWEHEIGVSYKTQAFQIYVPVGVILDMNATTIKSTNVTVSGDGENSLTQSDTEDGYARIYIKPEFIMPFKMGPMYQLKAGLDLAFDVYRNRAGVDTYTNYVTSSGTQTVKYEDQGYVEFDVYAGTSLEWSIAGNKIDFSIDPSIGLQYIHSNPGTYTITTDSVAASPVTSSYTNIVTPHVDVAIGSLYRPVEWFELRAGLSYGMNWENTIITTAYSTINQDGGYSEAKYEFYSTFGAYLGFGFVLGEDFNLDIYVQGGNNIDLANGGSYNATSYTTLTTITACGAQMTWRF